MSEDILSKDELDALMDGVRSGAVGTDAGAAPAGAVRAHDFANPERVASGRMPVLAQIQERAARTLREKLSRVLHRGCEVAGHAVEVVRFSECLDAILPSARMHVVRIDALRGSMLVAIDAAIASTFVEILFGGVPRFQAGGEERELTPSELRVVEIVLRETLAALAAAWQPVLALSFEPAGAAADAQFATLAMPREAVVAAKLEIALDGTVIGAIRVAIPHALLEPLRALLDGSARGGEPTRRDERWSATLRDDVLDAEIELASNLVETRIRIGDFLKLRPGDVVPIDLPDLVTVSAGEIPIFHARFGTSSGSNAVRVVEAVARRGAAHPVKDTP